MSESPAESAPPASETAKAETPIRQRASLRKRLRLALRSFVLAAACALTLFWIYTFYAIGAQANPKGDGMESTLR